MNLTELKAAAETAKTSPAELELWQMELLPDDVLRLVEVARLATEVAYSQSAYAMIDLKKALKGIDYE